VGGVTSPTGRTVKHWSSVEFRVLPQRGPVHHPHKADVASVEMRAAKRLCEKCALCGEPVMALFFSLHCREKGDANHLALEVMGT
jgi:hypothetical protein